jgi:UDP-N-acetyl-D-mannosaminuronic acid transferase (WecB/TagA/CpsF family)
MAALVKHLARPASAASAVRPGPAFDGFAGQASRSPAWRGGFALRAGPAFDGCAGRASRAPGVDRFVVKASRGPALIASVSKMFPTVDCLEL